MQTEELTTVGWKYIQSIQRAVSRFDYLSRDLMQPFGLTNIQGLSLMFISRKPGTTQAGLVAALDSDAAAISAILKRLEHRELVVRRRVTGNARANALTLTEEGSKIASHLQIEFDKLASVIGGTIPAKGGRIIQDWLASILAIQEI